MDDATRTGTGRPAHTGFHHFSPTVNDVETSAGWYEQVFGLQRVPVTLPHHGPDSPGYAVLLMDPQTGMAIGLHHHEGHERSVADERRTGLDHMAFGVADRAELDRWAAWLDELAIDHSGVTDTDDPMPYSVLVFRDPDNIQLELIHLPA